VSVKIVLLSRGYDVNRWLCEKHIHTAKARGWEVKASKEPPHALLCDDCEDVGTVLDAAIAAADKAARGEPEPVPVLPGQRKLF
jgi:hypothetical protein